MRLIRGGKVHPGLHNKNLSAVVKTDEISLAAKHAKVRRAGYGERLLKAGERSDVRQLDAIAHVTRHQR